MGYAVGVDFGSVLSTAGIVKWDNECPHGTEDVRVADPVPSAAYVKSDNELLVGVAAHQRGVLNPQRVIRDFTRRLGDPVPIMVGEWTGQTEDIIATGIRRLVDDIAAEEGARPDAIAVTHPASWGPYKQELLVTALARAGLADVMLVSEPRAAAEDTARFAPGVGRTVIVYDLGGGSFQATVMARAGDGGFIRIGQTQSLDWLGGSDFDQAIFTRVQRTAGFQLAETTDQAVLESLGQLRRDCTVAKELLSIDTEATVTVLTGGRRSRIRLVRSEFEELIRDAIDDTVDATRRAIHSAGMTERDIDAVVLAGGSSRIPLVAQVISAEFGLPIVVGSRPEASTSLGAAWLAGRGLRARSDDSADPATGDDDLPTENVLPDQFPPDQLPPDQLPGRRRTNYRRTIYRTDPLPAGQPAGRPPEAPRPAAPARPIGRRDQSDGRGRHRRRVRRYWLRVVGTVAAAAVIISAGSAIATSQASDRNSPGGSPLPNPVGAPATTSIQVPAPAAETAPPNAVGAPAVISDRSELLPQAPVGDRMTDPGVTGVSSATP